MKAPDGIEATALKIIVTDATDGCDVALGSIEAAGSWSTEGVKVACESDDSNKTKTKKKIKKMKMVMSQKMRKNTRYRNCAVCL